MGEVLFVVIVVNGARAQEAKNGNVYLLSLALCRGKDILFAGIIGLVEISAEERVGIDIESQERDFERAKSRFMSCEELALCDKSEFAGYVWCAKEAMYKLYGRRGIDLSNDLQIKSFDPKSETMRGLLLGEPEAQIEIRHYDDNIVAVATFTKE